MTDTFGARLRAARENAHLPQIEVVIAVRQKLGRSRWISQSKLQRIETGAIPEQKVDSFLLLFLADLYGVKLSDISEMAVEDVKTCLDLPFDAAG